MVLEVKKALKDFGVAQGKGRHAKEMQAARAKAAFDRLGRVARLGLPRPKLARLTAGSALATSLYGWAAHARDTDLLPTMRRWVMYALYKDSHLAQVRLFLHLVPPCKAADPC